MKNLHLLTWLTQLGFSTAVPLAGFILLAVWLRNRFDCGIWVLFVGIGLGSSVFSVMNRDLAMLQAIMPYPAKKQ